MGRSRRGAGRGPGRDREEPKGGEEPKGQDLLRATVQVNFNMASASSGRGASLLRFLRLVGQLKVSERARPGRDAAVQAQAPSPRSLPSLSPAVRGLDVLGRSWRGGDQAEGRGGTRNLCKLRAGRRPFWSRRPLPLQPSPAVSSGDLPLSQ